MKRFLLFTLHFPPLALFIYVFPLLMVEGLPKADFVAFLVVAGYSVVIAPAWAADGVGQTGCYLRSRSVSRTLGRRWWQW